HRPRDARDGRRPARDDHQADRPEEADHHADGLRRPHGRQGRAAARRGCRDQQAGHDGVPRQRDQAGDRPALKRCSGSLKPDRMRPLKEDRLMAAGPLTAKLLHVDVTARQTRVEDVPENILRRHLGGGAMAAWLLLRELKPGVDPLGPDNVLVFMTSVINGLSLSGTNRYTAAAKSPLTGGYGESEAGGWWGPELRAAGWDGLVIRGEAASPVYLWIKDDKVEFRDASRYWGQLSGEVQDGVEQELGDKRVRILQTGVSGERGVRFAAIVNQLKHFHGRSGLGAVMGAKNLKAVVVRGSKPPVAGDKEKAKSQLV